MLDIKNWKWGIKNIFSNNNNAKNILILINIFKICSKKKLNENKQLIYKNKFLKIFSKLTEVGLQNDNENWI